MVAAMIACKIEEVADGCEDSSFKTPRVVLCGGFSIDIIAKSQQYVQDNSNIGKIEVILGGCVRNVLECLHRLNIKDCLPITSLGNDILGRMLREWMESSEITQKGLHTSENYHTALYACTMYEELANGISDMEILANIPISHFKNFTKSIEDAKVIVIDSNLSIDAIEWLCDTGKNAIIAFDPISVEKSKKLLEKNLLSKITLLKGNIKQIATIASHTKPQDTTTPNPEELINTIFAQAAGKESRLRYVIATRENEAICGCWDGKVKVVRKVGKKVEKEAVVSCGGAGDSLMGGFIYGLLNNYEIEKSIEIGMKCAELSIISKYNVNPELSPSSIQ
eukprot:TRINITY_DN5182_c0_g1_i3.p2 TRINITY_DN5182_c0_g1~~TRINITY_DN5182_c0_g1_i3.p2  ORF type:complete len:337 (-),score=65.33 TRINITY_DN5182_c0_g1_i3:130-1140(-)